MKAIRVIKPLEVVIEEVEQPRIEKNDEVLIKMKAAGICGSDVHIYHGTSPVATYPRVIGHEMVGVIEAVGREVSKVKVGDRVIVNQIVSCGQCYACKRGRGNVCGFLKVRGVHIDGGYQEYIIAPEHDVFILPDKLPFEQAVLLEPISIAVQGVSRAELKDDDTVLILGAGNLGSSLLQIAKLTGATIIMADIAEHRLTDAKKNGAHYTINSSKTDLFEEVMRLTDGYGATASIDAACTRDSLPLLIKCTGNAGRVITMGFIEEPSEVAQFRITAKELDIRGSRLQNKRFPTVIKLFEEDKISFEGMISHVMPYYDIQKALDMIDSRDPSVKKIVLSF